MEKNCPYTSCFLHCLIGYVVNGGLDGKESACNVGGAGSTPGSGKFPGEGNGNPLQYFCLGNPIDRGAWQARVHGIKKTRS